MDATIKYAIAYFIVAWRRIGVFVAFQEQGYHRNVRDKMADNDGR